MATTNKTIHPSLEKLQKGGALSAQEIHDLQSHVDELERKSLAAHGDSVQSSHFHPSAFLGVGTKERP